MKKINLIVVALLAITSMTGQMSAQLTSEDALKNRTKSNNANERKIDAITVRYVGRVTSSITGCDIVFEYPNATLREGSTPSISEIVVSRFAVSSEDNLVVAINDAPVHRSKSAASGQSTFRDLRVTFYQKGRSEELPVVDGEFRLPDDFHDGECDIALAWDWEVDAEVTKSGATFTCSLQDGVVTDMAINEKATPFQKNH